MTSRVIPLTSAKATRSTVVCKSLRMRVERLEDGRYQVNDEVADTFEQAYKAAVRKLEV